MANVAAKIGVKTLSIAIGIPVGIVTKRAVERVWHAARPEAPPRKPTDPDVSWRDAVAWAALSAAGVAAAQLVTTKAAVSVWRTLTGNEPTHRNSAQANKANKANKADKADKADKAATTN